MKVDPKEIEQLFHEGHEFASGTCPKLVRQLKLKFRLDPKSLDIDSGLMRTFLRVVFIEQVDQGNFDDATKSVHEYIGMSKLSYPNVLEKLGTRSDAVKFIQTAKEIVKVEDEDAGLRYLLGVKTIRQILASMHFRPAKGYSAAYARKKYEGRAIEAAIAAIQCALDDLHTLQRVANSLGIPYEAKEALVASSSAQEGKNAAKSREEGVVEASVARTSSAAIPDVPESVSFATSEHIAQQEKLEPPVRRKRLTTSKKLVVGAAVLGLIAGAAFIPHWQGGNAEEVKPKTAQDIKVSGSTGSEIPYTLIVASDPKEASFGTGDGGDKSAGFPPGYMFPAGDLFKLRPPDEPCELVDLNSWSRANGGISVGGNIARITIAARDKPMVISSASIGRTVTADSLQGERPICQPKGGSQAYNYLKLDIDSQTAVFREGDDLMPGVEKTDKPFYLSLDPGKSATVLMRSTSNNCYCEWWLDLSITVDGQTYIHTINDNGNPFVVAPKSVNYPYYKYNSGAGQWLPYRP
ncbi:hypothetical protein [Umezawaea tangerina]|uniref:Uncharacterized protein n=1 Tax=Umezawaea tangerina TaxID=84725 RepID=A0A2T0T4B5_9PSEU|nr:hypothetical protein [Umezawaea tangerina]PRY40516.1 hypothetical protein CLV43_106253 [Umezawaea tangerina]